MRSLNDSAATQAIRRLCTPSVKTGKAKLSKELVQKFTAGGAGRRELVNLWIKCGADVEPLFQQLHDNNVDVTLCSTALFVL